MKTLFRWLFRLFLVLMVLVVLAVIGALLLKDTIAKSLAEKNLRDGTGMDAKIAKLEVGLMTPTVNLESLKLYNTAEFGGGTFVEMPELRVEYVPREIREGKLHFKTVRLHIAEVNVVKNKNGKTNIDILQGEANKKSGGTNTNRGGKKKTDVPGVDFGGIDTLYLTVGKIKYTDLGDPRNNQEIQIGLKDEVGHNLKTEADVATWFGSVVLKLAFQQMMQNRSSGVCRIC
jgi:uncharacterized protein involved in outer membrane biogenesis